MLILIFVDLLMFAFIPFGPFVFSIILVYSPGCTIFGQLSSFNNQVVTHLASELRGS